MIVKQILKFFKRKDIKFLDDSISSYKNTPKYVSMMNYEKRKPALTDTDKITFGKYQGKMLQDVPAGYLLWLYEESNIKEKNIALYNYIHNSMDAILLELKEK